MLQIAWGKLKKAMVCAGVVVVGRWNLSAQGKEPLSFDFLLQDMVEEFSSWGCCYKTCSGRYDYEKKRQRIHELLDPLTTREYGEPSFHNVFFAGDGYLPSLRSNSVLTARYKAPAL